MSEFAGATGLAPESEGPVRYLWTDAFAVCNFLELYRRRNDAHCLGLALTLVDQGHAILGRHRQDDPRNGWISGLDEEEGRRHPTAGGLRIGKKMKERSPSERLDEHLEWDRDGQYYHYLTKWMHALNRVSQVTGNTTYLLWAVELAKTAHARFVYTPSSGGCRSMHWKMSIDLSRPLVPSMGHHDPLDGLITYCELQSRLAAGSDRGGCPDLSPEIDDMAEICKGRSWATDDPLGIGGLLANASHLAQLIARGGSERTELLESLLHSALVGLESYLGTNTLLLPAVYRLAFREFGLSIGLRGIKQLEGLLDEKTERFKNSGLLRQELEALLRYDDLPEGIERFWLAPSSREAGTWKDHRAINMVMLATSLAPDGLLSL